MLVDNPQNARRPHRDREGLAPSIGALGMLNPPLVRQLEDGRLEIIAGERRKYSAIKAGLATIPVFVRDDLSPVHQLAGMLVENHDREGLTPTEEAVAIAQLAGFEGVSQRDITTMTGIKAGVVRNALKVAASEVATAIGERHELNLDQLMVLAEFDTDAEAVKTLTVTALKDPGRFDHLVAQLRRNRDDRVAYDAVAAQITESGVPLVELENGWWLPEGAYWLSDLPAPGGARTFTPAKHRTCPGHCAAVVETDDGYELAYICLDPVGQSHIDQATACTATTSPATDAPASAMTDEQKAERRKVITNNKAWETATPVRREYVTELVARRSVPKGTLRYVTEVIMADPAGLAAGNGDGVASLIGKDTNPGRAWDRTAALALASEASDARLPLVLLAQVAASVEARFGERQGWRHPAPGLVAYLRFLATCGYGLSEVEQEAADSGEDPKGTNRAPRSILATAPAQPGLLRVSTQFGIRTPRAQPDMSPSKSTLPEL
jgi:ParB family transcriptional regulator, chromosome partitioning protein